MAARQRTAVCDDASRRSSNGDASPVPRRFCAALARRAQRMFAEYVDGMKDCGISAFRPGMRDIQALRRPMSYVHGAPASARCSRCRGVEMPRIREPCARSTSLLRVSLFARSLYASAAVRRYTSAGCATPSAPGSGANTLRVYATFAVSPNAADRCLC